MLLLHLQHRGSNLNTVLSRSPWLLLTKGKVGSGSGSNKCGRTALTVACNRTGFAFHNVGSSNDWCSNITPTFDSPKRWFSSYPPHQLVGMPSLSPVSFLLATTTIGVISIR
jgi:hypothetical protein